MLAHRLRRWPNINPTIGQRLVFATTAYGRKAARLTADTHDSFNNELH